MRYLCVFTLALLFSCKSVVDIQNEKFCSDLSLSLYPNGTTIPVNIAPFNILFAYNVGDNNEFAFFSFDSTGVCVDSVSGKLRNKIFALDENTWKKFLEKAYMGHVQFCSEQDTFKWFVAESIDSFITYRVNAYNELFSGYSLRVEQRNLSSFDVKNLFNSNSLNGNCMNCHSANKNDMNTFTIQIRGDKFTGTYFYHNRKMTRVVLPQEYSAYNLTFPSWHPSSRVVAFSTNRNIHPTHYIDSASGKMLDFVVEDPDKGILIYDLEKNFIFSSPFLTDTNFTYSFPCWNNAGTVLYFCRSKRLSLKQFRDYRFDLLAIAFDTSEWRFTGQPFMVYPFSKDGVSVTMPSMSPTDNFLIVSLLPNGMFPSLNKGDLCLVYTDSVAATGHNAIRMLDEINSPDGEKYHTFSSNGRWIVFSSKRINGETASPFFAYIGTRGIGKAPFALPQKDVDFYCKNTTSNAFPSFGKNSAAPDNKGLNHLLGKAIAKPRFSPDLKPQEMGAANSSNSVGY